MNQQHQQNISDEDLQLILEALYDIASLQFSKKIKVSDTGGIANVLATGINMLSEEVEDKTVRIEELVRSEQKFRDLLLIIQEGLVVVSPEFNILLVNKKFQEITGYSSEELIGHNLQKFISTVIELGPQSKNTTKTEIELRRKDGSNYWASLSISHNFSTSGELTNVVFLITDISKRKFIEMRQQAVFRIVNQSNTAKIDSRRIAETIGDEINRVINIDDLCIVFRDPNSGELSFLISTCPLIDKVTNSLASSADFINFLIQKEKPIISHGNDLNTMMARSGKIWSKENPPQALLSVPIKTDDIVTGVIICISHSDNVTYRQSDLDFVNYISGHIGVLYDRIKIEENLENSEKQYRNLFSKMNEGILYSSNMGIIDMVNPAFCELTGYSRKELIGKNGYEFLHSDKFTDALKTKRAQRLLGISDTYELEFIRKDGRAILTEITSYPNIDGKNNFIGVLSIIRDITEKRQKDEEAQRLFNQIKNSEKQYKSLLADLPVAVILVEPNSGVIVDCNESSAEFFGKRTKDELRLKHIYDFVHEDSLQQIEELLVLDSENKRRGELKFLSTRGVLYGDTSIVKTTYGDAVSVIMLSLVDITQRKKAELINTIAFEIASKANEKNLSTRAFCEFIKQQLNPIVDTSEFYIAQETNPNELTFHYVQDSHYNGVLPFVRNHGEGLSEYVIKTGKSLILIGSEIEKFQRDNGMTIYGETAKSWIGAPIMLDGKAVGIIACQSYVNDDIYHDEHRRILEVVGAHLGSFFERAMANQKLIKSEERYRGFVENSTEITLVISGDEKIIYASPSVYKVLGYDENEVVGTRIIDYIHPDDLPLFIDDQKRSVTEASPSAYHIRKILDKSGEPRLLRWISSNQLRNPSIRGIIINAQEVTELISVQENLRIEHKNGLKYQSMLLSSQLNPHFIFNSLNSIQYYILERDPTPALMYLSDFSKLMRLVLSNSTKEFITLEEEIEFLELYLGLEKTRYRDKFSFVINIKNNINIYDLLIPPMLLQPYVENAIIHGVGSLQNEQGLISIEFSKNGDNVVCSIEDNGTGREKAMERKKLRVGNVHKSYSTKINNKRFEILNSLKGSGYSGTIHDLKDNQDQPQGTRVVITFPFLLDDE
jgi:PAS domain S-box-containing protein